MAAVVTNQAAKAAFIDSLPTFVQNVVSVATLIAAAFRTVRAPQPSQIQFGMVAPVGPWAAIRKIVDVVAVLFGARFKRHAVTTAQQYGCAGDQH